VSFHEISLPLALALGAHGGPERRVDITALASGYESRTTPWAHGRRRFDIGGAVRTLDQLHALVVFFEARRGKLHGFRFRDFLDWKSCAPSQTPSGMDQEIGIGDGARTGFQLIKTYGEGESAYLRPIQKPQAESVLVAIDGALCDASDFTLEATTGFITFATAPADGAAISAGFLFDTPVRFDADRLDLSLDAFGAGRALSVPLVEILV
jgi:uncharacterized protein (TIGR02217 family)